MTHPSHPGPEAVAIIGVALALPDADDLDTLHENLLDGRSSIREPGKDRVHYAGAPADVDYLRMGYLSRIDLFDHRFFGLSLREAELMDPHQRMAAQLAHRAFENACYAPGALKGSRTAVVLSTPEPHYASLYTGDDPQQLLGAHPSAVAARIAYLLDLAGPSLVVDTACSSSLTAIAVAVENLRNGQADLALAGGLSLYPVMIPERDRVPMLGLESPDGVCRPFDARADGSTGGEGGGLVVLKRLSDALADGDHVHGVLTGIALNHNGFRATSMSAPSARGQAEVIVEAWRQAGTPRLDHIECHGSGTRLGDVIEAEGLRQAFADVGADAGADVGAVVGADASGSDASGDGGAGNGGTGSGGAGSGAPTGISGIKGNIGHLNHAAGVAGLFKVLAGLRHGTRYPNPNFETPNPLIDFTGPVRVDVDATPWPRTEGGTRRAGVSSFGLTGTNVHAVVEEPPAPAVQEPGAPEAPGAAEAAAPAAELVTLSAKSPKALAVYAERVAAFLDRTGHPLAQVAHALNRGRDDHPHRWAGTARDTRDLADLLRAARPGERAPAAAAPLVLLFSGDADLGDDTWTALGEAFPRLTAPAPEHAAADASPGARLLARQHAAYRLARSLGLTEARLVGSGIGNLVVRGIQNPATADASRRAAATAPLTGQVDEAGLRRAVRSLADEGAVLVEMGADGTLAREISRVAPELPLVRLFADPSREGVLGALGALYSYGVDIDWSRYYAERRPRRVELPTYPFDADEVSCWCRPPGAPLLTAAAGVSAGTVAGRAASAPGTAGGPGDTEKRLADIWERVLKADEVGPDANYFMLGGTSIAGITVLREAETHFGVHLTFADLHQYPVLRDLAARIDALRSTGREQDDWTITPVTRPGRLPLSFNQEQLWYLDRLQPGTPLYNIPTNTRYVGDFDLAAFRGALRDVVDRHEVLRTRILDNDGRPYALADVTEPRFTFLDLAALPDAARAAELSRVMTAEATEPFDLGSGPLFRTVVVRTGARDHVVLHTWHHIVFDGWAPAVFYGELSACYTARRTGRTAELPELPVQYADFAAWQREWLDAGRIERGLAYWRGQLSGLTAPELPTDHPRPAAQSYRGAYVKFALDQDLSDRIRQFSVGESTTSFVTMLAVVDAVLHLWAGQSDVVVGAATTGRFNPATHGLIGYFNNLLPFRTKVDPGLGFRDLVARCAATATGVLDHEEIPFAKIVADTDHRDPSRHPVFTVCYTHQNTVSASLDLAGLTPESVGDDLSGVSGVAPGTSKFDLTFGLYDQDGGPMTGYLEYAVDLFEEATARRLVDLFQEIAAAATSTPDRPLAELGTAPAPSGSSGSTGPSDPSAPSLLVGERRTWAGENRLVTEVFQEHAARRPDEVAVVDAAGEHTFAELDRRANRLAHRLLAHGVGPDRAVPVLAARGAELVVGWLGVLKAGGAVATLDPALPAGRLHSIVSGITAAVLVLGEGMTAGMAGADPDVPVVRIADAVAGAGGGSDGGAAGAAGADGAAYGDTPPPQRARARDLAYVTHTSGSTGHPHGCEVEHRSLLNLLHWFGEEAGLTTADRIAQMAAPGFDLALLEVMSALLHGATLCFVQDLLQTPEALLGALAEHRVTVAGLPTLLAETLLTDLPEVPGLALRFLLTGGDLLRVRPLRRTPFALLNAYGPTECAVCVTGGRVAVAGGAGTDRLPDIGRPFPNVRVYLLDAAGRPVPRGEEGEVYLGGTATGRGYHGRPGLTASRFVADPYADEPGARMYRTGDLAAVRADGTIDFRGRTDDQLELRGHRVEPAEIERVLMAHPGVREALVLAERQPSGAPLLVAHVAGADAPAEAELTAWAARELPDHMVPGRVRHHDDLPRTSNGKLDRKRMRKREMLDRDTKHATTAETVEMVGTTGATRATGATGMAGTATVAVGETAAGAAEMAAVTTAVTSAAVVDDAGREAERVLGGIWAELLGVDRVAPGDNFFRIGGDSLLSVGIASRATRAGLPLTPHDVLSHPTLRELALLAAGAAAAAGATGASGASGVAGAAGTAGSAGTVRRPAPIAGAATPGTAPATAPATVSATVPGEPVPPAPLVHALLTGSPDGAKDFVTPLILETAPGIRADAVRAAFERLVELQEPLRYRFRQNSLGWRIDCVERESARIVDATVLPPLDEEALQAWLTGDLDELVAAVDLDRGPVLRARFYDRGADLPGLVLLVVHHFVSDSTSLVPLLEDLDAALAGEAPTAPRRAAWREWTHLLRAMATSDEVAGELPYWKGILGAAAGARPVPEDGADGAPAGLVRRTLDGSLVGAQLTENGPAGQHAALAAVAVAWSRWRGEPGAFLSTVGMGSAPNALWNGDRTESMGWFTHVFPSYVRVPSGAGTAETLPVAAAALRSVPNDGIGYGVLRHLSPPAPQVDALRALPEPQVLVEHVASGNDGLTKLGGASIRPRPMTLVTLPDSMLGQVPIVVETHVRAGVLELGVVHRGSFATADMEAFADHLVEAFAEYATGRAAGAATEPATEAIEPASEVTEPAAEATEPAAEATGTHAEATNAESVTGSGTDTDGGR
ncbi:amino acid adenylation domain-containing protein [Streptomyces sp. p1417]|uniref:Amino acid adenylation domain-containing protein n=1 Tax=Streptomyces typhae TaxID=2681492 RepID=A0A6L6WY99_9ACTN|nr:non-ribosomal peptide synthetase [Streptomyces typhae]MVO86457.1 amino acid adenylation domain-containing protein [Streptomyces typhae]